MQTNEKIDYSRDTPVKYNVVISTVARDSEVQRLESEIERLQDEIDVYNHTTEINF